MELTLAKGVAVSVVVMDRATGRPIPGATVHMSFSHYESDPRTDVDGRVMLQPMWAEQWDIEARAPGFARKVEPLNLEGGQDAAVEFQLGPGSDIEGVVCDPGGKPIPGAGVSVSQAGRFQQIAYVEADARGRYSLPSLPRGVDLQFDTSKENYIRGSVTRRIDGPRESLDLKLEPGPDGGSIAGVVLDPAGRPIAGAELINTGTSTSESRETRTGPDGRFRLDNLYSNSNFGKEVVVRAANSAPGRVKVQTGPRDRPTEVTIRLDAGHRIRGRVVDRQGRPIEGVRVYFANGNHGVTEGGRATTDRDGNFAFDALPPDCPFAFAKPGFSEIANRKLPLDTDDLIAVTMDPAGVIVGKVVDAGTGKPIRVSNVRITFSPIRNPGDPTNGLRSSMINPGQNFQSDEGLFRLNELVVGMPLQVTVSAVGYEPTIAERVVVAAPADAPTDEYRLVPLDRSGLRTYRGRLLDKRGKAVAGANLRLIAATDRTPENAIGFPFNWSMIESGQVAQQAKVTRFLEAVTDAEGGFAFPDVPRADLVEIVWWGKGVAPGRREELERTGIDEAIALTVPDPARLIGTVDREAFGDDLSVRISPPAMGLPDVTVQLKPGQATFEVNDLAPADYQVTLQGPPVRTGDPSGSFTYPALDTQRVLINPGEARRIRFGK